MRPDTKQQRVEICNAILKICASHGRRFFSQDADQPRMTNPRISEFSLDDRGRIWFTDRYSGKRIYVAYKYRWRGFTEGGTLRSLVESMRDYIRDASNALPYSVFGPWPEWICGGDPWGYGKEEMAEVRREVSDLFNQAR